MEGTYETDRVLPLLAERADAMVMVVYDLIPLLFSDPYLMKDNIAETHVGRLRRVKTADLLLAIFRMHPPRLRRALGGGSRPRRHYRHRRLGELRPAAGDEEPLVMRATSVSVDHAPVRHERARVRMAKERRGPHPGVRTNIGGAARHTDSSIACAVSSQGEASWRALARECGLAHDDLVITGYVDDAMLRALYQATSLFVFPSRYEGFGLPVAEAARCGAACITSDRGSLNEVLDMPASTFDPVACRTSRRSPARRGPGRRSPDAARPSRTARTRACAHHPAGPRTNTTCSGEHT